MDCKTTWIQCSNSTCGKWRIVRDEIAEEFAENPWTCDMNENSRYNKCSVAQEKIDVPRGKKLVVTKFPYDKGEIIMAKLTGYCLWPAFITPDPSCNEYYDAVLNDNDEQEEFTHFHVEFFGRPRTHSWINIQDIFPYNERNETAKVKKKWKRSYNLAMEDVHASTHLTCEERLKQCAFQSFDKEATTLKNDSENRFNSQNQLSRSPITHLVDGVSAKAQLPVTVTVSNKRGRPKTIRLKKTVQWTVNEPSSMATSMATAAQEKVMPSKKRKTKTSLKSAARTPLSSLPSNSTRSSPMHDVIDRQEISKAAVEKQLTTLVPPLQNPQPVKTGKGSSKTFMPPFSLETTCNISNPEHSYNKQIRDEHEKLLQALQLKSVQQSHIPTDSSSAISLAALSNTPAANYAVPPVTEPSTNYSPHGKQNVGTDDMRGKPSSSLLVPGASTFSSGFRYSAETLDAATKIKINELVTCDGRPHSAHQEEEINFNLSKYCSSPTYGLPTIGGERQASAQILGNEYVPSSNPSSPQVGPTEEDLEEDCGISIQRELEEMEKVLRRGDSVAPKGLFGITCSVRDLTPPNDEFVKKNEAELTEDAFQTTLKAMMKLDGKPAVTSSNIESLWRQLVARSFD